MIDAIHKKSVNTKKIVMVVEDEPSLLSVLEKKLGQLDCQLITAQDGVEASSLFERHQPDILVTDVIMPKINGFDLIQKLRAKYGTKFKVIVLTNLDNPSDQEMAKSLEVDALLLKSNTSLRSVEQKVAELLRK